MGHPVSEEHPVGATDYEGPRTRRGRFAPRPPRASVAAKERQAVELRLAGLSLEQIAERVGYANRSAVSKAIRRAVARTNADVVDEYKDLELQRLEALQRAVWAKAMAGDLKAVDRALAIGSARSRLLGLNAPVRTDLRITGDVDQQILELADELAAAGSPAPADHPG